MIGLVEQHPAWALGFLDETWWSRVAQPALHAWAEEGHPLRLMEREVPKSDPDPKALACYGLLVRWSSPEEAPPPEVWLRFVQGRPVSGATSQFLEWCCGKLERLGKRVLALIWDNAAWHQSHQVRDWLRAHNRMVKQQGKGVRILSCFLPTKSPWLNPIEPRWVHGKRAIVEPARLLSAQEVAERVCTHFGCVHEPHLIIPENDG